MSSSGGQSGSKQTPKNGDNKYLSGAFCIWQLTLNQISKICCMAPVSSKQFLWMIFKQNAGITIAYFLLYLAFGMCVGFLGPALEDLACFTKETVSAVSWAIFAQTCLMVIGIFLAGLLSKW